MKPIPRVLLLEDNSRDADLVREVLAQSSPPCEVVQVGHREEYLEALTQERYDLILCDYKLPGFDGLAALNLAHHHCPDIPCLLLTGVLGDELAVESLKAGATDFLLKDRLARLAPAVHRALGEVQARVRCQELEREALRAQSLESLSRLARGIAHDLNNALAPMLMGLDVLRARFPEKNCAPVLDAIETSARRGATMIQQVLTFARGLGGKPSLIPLARLVKDAQRFVQETFPPQVRFRADLEPELWPIHGEPAQLLQLLLNLCVNARESMAQGGLLTVSARNVQLDEPLPARLPQAKPGSYVVISVADTGPHIPAEELARIFEPFSGSKEDAAGLQLSTSESIARSQGGFMTADSRPGVGNFFHTYLPALHPAGPGAGLDSRPAPPHGHGELILVVEDEASLREMTKAVIENHGYKTLLANDGTEAINWAMEKSKEIRLVLLDMALPFMDGRATLCALRKIDPNLHYVISTGRPSEDSGPVAEPGVVAVLEKPYTPEQLLRTLAAALSSSPPSAIE